MHAARWKALAASSLLVLSLAGPASADMCDAKKLKSAGKSCMAALKCYALAAKEPAVVDPACLTAAQSKHLESAAKVESAETCSHPEVDQDVFDALTSFASTAASELDYDAGGTCPIKKLKATARKCKSFFGCESKAAKDDLAVDAQCLSAASGKFTEAFTAIEAKYTCSPVGNVGTVETMVDDVVVEVVSLLNNGTTTTSSTTTTTMNGGGGNTAPSITSVSVSPVPAYETTVLTCTPNGAFDADGDTVSYLYHWEVNGSPAGTTANLTGSSFNKGNAVTCRVTPTDGIDPGTPVTSSVVTIQNTAPTHTTSVISPTTAYETTTLTCTPGGESDADGDTVSFFYEWYTQGVLQVPTGSTLTGTYFNKGNLVHCISIPNDGTASGPGVQSAYRSISNSPPTITSVTLGPTPATEASTLTCTANGFSDPDGDGEGSHFYYWEVNGSSAGNTPTLTGSSFNAGDSVQCFIIPHDGEGYAAGFTASNTIVIQP